MTADKPLDDILASIRQIIVAPDAAPPPAVEEPDIDEALLDPDFDTLPLTDLVEPAAPAGVAIDETARALLQPMLQAWLDANLPEIVEAAVAAEIRRLTGIA